MNQLFLVFILSCLHSVRGVNYIGVSGSATWSEAKAACQNGIYVKVTGGQLATWNDYNQYRDAVRHAYVHSGGEAWVGLTDDKGDGSDGHWHFIDDIHTNRQGMNEWSNGEPNDLGNEDCAHVWGNPTKAGDAYGLNDAGCGNRKNFICEFSSISVGLAAPGKQDVITSPNLDFPNEDGFDNKNNYFIFEFSSDKDMVILASIMLNVVLMAAVCGLATKRACGTKSGAYSKVNMYSTDAEDEKFNV